MRILPLSLIAGALAVGVSSAAPAQMKVENRDLLSPTERDAYHEQMRGAGWEDREGVRTEHSGTVRERASTRGTDMSAPGRGMKDGDHGQGMRDGHAQDQARGPRGDGTAHGAGVGGTGSGHKYGPGGGGHKGGMGGSHGKGKKGK